MSESVPTTSVVLFYFSCLIPHFKIIAYQKNGTIQGMFILFSPENLGFFSALTSDVIIITPPFQDIETIFPNTRLFFYSFCRRSILPVCPIISALAKLIAIMLMVSFPRFSDLFADISVFRQCPPSGDGKHWSSPSKELCSAIKNK